MKVCLVHNAYGKFSGEEAVFLRTVRLLSENGHKVVTYERSSSEIPSIPLGKFWSFFSGIHNPFAKREFARLLDIERPDIIHVHNLYPLISPAILPVARIKQIPVVMTVHNYRLVCPNGLHYSKGEVCVKCAEGREYWCVLRNCEKSYAKSLGYALRSWWARYRKLYLENVDYFICLSSFQSEWLTKCGIDSKKIVIVSNMVRLEDERKVKSLGDFVGYAGRISQEKGIDQLIAVADKCRDIPFKIAGETENAEGYLEKMSSNIQSLGYCNSHTLSRFYANARMLIVPSVCWETFGLVVVEAMLFRKPVICSNVGGLTEIVDDGVTGFIVESGDIGALEEKIRYLWERPGLCQKMGSAGYEKAVKEYGEKEYYENLIGVFKKAVIKCKS